MKCGDGRLVRAGAGIYKVNSRGPILNVFKNSTSPQRAILGIWINLGNASV